MPLSRSVLFVTLLACAPTSLRAQTEDASLPVVTVEAPRPQLHASGVSQRVAVDPLAAADLADVLDALPGVQVRSAGGLGSYSEASLRGSSGRQVRVLLDGLPLDAGGGEAASLALVSPLLLDEVEVYKGRVPLALGSGLAGTLNLRSRTTLAAPLTANASIGSFGQRQFGAAAQLAPRVQLVAGTQAADNDFEYVNEFAAFDPADPDGRSTERRRNAGTRQHFAQSRYDGALRVAMHWLDDAQELPTRANLPGNRSELLTRAYGLSIATPETADWQAQLAYRHTREQFRDPASEIGLDAQDARALTQHSLLRLRRQLGAVQLLGSAAYTDYSANDRLDEVPTAAARRLDLSPGAEWVGEPGWLGVALNASLLVNYSSEDADNRSAEEWRVEPALGATRAFGNCVAATNVGQRERLPTFFERYGDRGLFRGNPDLAPESATYADLGARCVPGEVLRSLQVTVFGQDLRDAISPTYNAQGVGRSVNTARAQIGGLELALGLAWAGFDAQIGGTYQHSEDQSEVRATRGQQLPGRFERQLYARLERGWRGLRAHYAFRYEDGQFYDSPNLLPAEPLREHDLGLRGAYRRLGWSVQARNLRDDHPEQFNGFPRPGRHWLLAFSYPQSLTSGVAP